MAFKNIMGMVLPVVGMIIYNWAVELEKQSINKALPLPKNSLTEEEIRLLKEGMENSPVKGVELGDSK
ncbi:UDP-galactose transporter 2 [Morella rubra]|uniref:UDP-galactose transporter 2 n=1 Tax=Morella rubra TaxID=262757 RepID=A0A6A1WN25_9ROSI|nr:UDP-galactose transporter 2 [Morella rubra]